MASLIIGMRTFWPFLLKNQSRALKRRPFPSIVGFSFLPDSPLPPNEHAHCFSFLEYVLIQTVQLTKAGWRAVMQAPFLFHRLVSHGHQLYAFSNEFLSKRCFFSSAVSAHLLGFLRANKNSFLNLLPPIFNSAKNAHRLEASSLNFARYSFLKTNQLSVWNQNMIRVSLS